MHRSHMLSVIPGNDIIINSIDLEEDNHGNVPCHEHTTTLPLQLVLKLEIMVEIYAYNYDSWDVLVNEYSKAIRKQKNLMSFGLSSMNRI